MRIAVIGGGPGGLYFAALARQFNPEHEITIWERNGPGDTFGFGVVFSDQTLGNIGQSRPAVLREMRRTLAQWDDIDVHYRGTTFTAGGNGFAAIGRTGLLGILQRHCAQLGVPIHFRSEVTEFDALTADHDLVVAADGANSAVRSRYADAFRPSVDTGTSRYIWLGSDLELASFKFYILDTPGGVMQVHAYPDSGHASTFILELSEEAWRCAGFEEVDASALAPGESDERSIGIIAGLCKDILGGHKLFGNNSRWLRFPTVRCETWRHHNVVLIGDAAHTAHFSIGSGTKLAMDDSLALATSLREQPSVDAALAAYEAERRPVVASLQRAAETSRAWFENIDHYTRQEPQQFAVNLLTRSRRVSYASLRRRDPEFVARAESWFAGSTGQQALPPMCQPFMLGRLELANRLVTTQAPGNAAGDGVPGDLQLVRLGGRALDGAGLVLTGPVAPSAAGGWRRIVEFVHAHTPAKIGVQLGCDGAHGSAQAAGELRSDFAAAAERAASAGFDLLELDCGHGCLLGDAPDDALEIFAAMRAHWPGDRPASVRITPARWPARNSAEAAVDFANAFAHAGATAVHVATGAEGSQVDYADRIRNQAGRAVAIAVISEGSISAPDVSPIVLAGHVDLCVIDQRQAHPLECERGAGNER